jgi:hypothetical protein
MQYPSRTTLLSIACAATALSCAAHALADTASFGASKDNTLYESPTGSTSNGAGNFLFAGRNSQSTNSIRRGLLAFDLTSIPAGSTINAVTLTLHQDSPHLAPESISLHRLLEDWGEGTSTGLGNGGPATPGDATWIHRSFNTLTWSTPGGVFLPTPSASTLVGGNGFFSWSSPTLVADVQSFVNNPSGNFGWIVLGNEGVPSSAKRFHTREETEPAFRPNLLIDYTPVPSPGVVALGLACAGGLSARRARGRARLE